MPLPAPSRTDRLLERINAELASIPSADRGAFLSRLIAGFEREYRAFVISGGKSAAYTDPADPPMAGDYLETITALAARREQQG